MNSLQHMLLKLGEEASEITKIALKTIQFGPKSISPIDNEFKLNNYQLLHRELDDLYATIEELNAKFNLNYVVNREAVERKKNKIEFFKQISIKLGFVKD